MSMMIVEHCQFKLNEGTGREAFLTTVQTTNEFLKECTGFIHRSLCFDESKGQWIDILHWDCFDNAHKAGEAFMSAPEAAGFMSLIKEDSVTMQHFPVAHEFSPGCNN